MSIADIMICGESNTVLHPLLAGNGKKRKRKLVVGHFSVFNP
jgi:hypothetical protein